MNIKRGTWLRPFFQVFAAIAGVLLLTAPLSFFNYKLFWAAGMVTLMGGIYVLPYAIWPETQGGFRLKLKKFFIIVLLLVGAALFMSERMMHRFPYGSGIALLLLFATAYFATRHLERRETSRN